MPRTVTSFSLYLETKEKLNQLCKSEGLSASRLVEQLILQHFAVVAIRDSLPQQTLHRCNEKQRKNTQDQIIRGLLNRSKLQAVNEVRSIDGGICNPRINGSCEICESIIKYEHDWRDANKVTMWGSGYFEKLD
jgi:predicted DNA-binding protein